MLGFELIGVARPEPSAHLRFYERWLAEGRHGGMAYLARPEAVARRADLRRTLATVRSVVVVATGYHTEPDPDDPPDPTRGVIARYARGPRLPSRHQAQAARPLGARRCARQVSRGRACLRGYRSAARA